ncbi:MAG TPA: hypothetical protein VGN57_07185 [Pirellulaceae bacterium]|jgi:hypothetical protein|nr:hypothetical protein [Pirellulaceae bacterium]
MTDETCAVLLANDERATLQKASPILAAATGEPNADALQRLVKNGGFALEGADRRLAEHLVQRLRAGGVEAFVVRQAEVIDPPAALEVRHGRIEARGFVYRSGIEELLILWESCVWIDLIELVERRVEPQVHYPYGDREFGQDENPLPRIEEDRPLALEILAVGPLRRLRIRNDRFAFAATGLKMHTNKRQNAIALAIAIGSRASDEGPGHAGRGIAELGPGMEWLRTGAPPRPERFDDPERYERSLRARLTRLRCEG